MADLGSLLGSAGIGGAIGKAIVSLELETTKYQAELKSAQASTVASTNSMGSNVSKFSSLASSAFAAIGVAAVAGLAYSVKAAIEANDALLKLQNTYENNAKLSDVTVKSFQDQAEAIQLLTGTSDEAILTAQALLGQFSITGKEVQTLTPLIVDLSEKMGIEMTAAAKSVGKAVEGNTSGLQRYGIVIDEAKGKGGEFDAVLKGLQGTVGGFAEQRAIDEPWRLLGAAIDEVAESIGNELLPMIRDLAETISNNLPVIEAFARGFGTLVDIFKDLEQISFAPWTVPGDAMRELGGQVDELNLKLPGFKQATDVVTGGIEDLAVGTEHAIHKIKEFGNVGKKEFEDFTKGIEDSVEVSVGEFEKLNDAFSITPKELQKQLDLAVQIARREQRILREIFASDDITKAQKEALANLPADMRDAWARAGKEGKNQIEQDAVELQRLNERTATQITRRFGEKAATGGKAAGGAMVQGIIDGLRAFAPGLYAMADQIVTQAIAAARAAAGAKSPSKKMMELGVDMMVGLANGISDAEQKAIDAARKAMEKVIDQVSSQLHKIKGKAQSFADAIKGGFSGFLDIGGAFGSAEEGTSLSDIIATQVGGAQTLADVLEALKRQGASKGLLAQVAESGSAFGQAILQGGPEQIKEMNAALKTISDLAQETGKGLSEKFFGDKIDSVEKKLDKLHDDLRELNALEREGHKHDIVVDGQKLAEATRSELIKTGKRNDGTGIL